MFNDLRDTVVTGDNVIIALGDSFTQGVGAYSIESWKKSLEIGKGNVFNLSGKYFREEQHKNNWATQLRDNHLPDYKVWNLGINGTGNRGTIKEMYLNPLPTKLGNVIVILMATGLERFDFLKKNRVTCGLYNHSKWQTIWPVKSERGLVSEMEKVYLNELYSPRVIATEFLLNVAEAQYFCKANNYKFMFASAFDSTIYKRSLIDDLDDDPDYINIIDWDNLITPCVTKTYKSFKTYMDLLCFHENDTRFRTFRELKNNNIVENMQLPLKYITPCGHWTIEGQAFVASNLADEIKTRKLAT